MIRVKVNYESLEVKVRVRRGILKKSMKENYESVTLSHCERRHLMFIQHQFPTVVFRLTSLQMSLRNKKVIIQPMCF